MITILVKGPGYIVRKHAEERDIELSPMSGTPTRFGEQVVKCHDNDLEKVVKWFMETHLQEAPYPVGTLLWYGIGGIV